MNLNMRSPMNSKGAGVRLPHEWFLRCFQRKLMGEMLFILFCALLPAMAFHGYRSLTPDAKAIVTPINEDVLWIDARSEADFATDHIPGAFSLNEKNWEKALPSLFETWQSPQPIVVYCSAGCPASARIAAKLIELGIEPVRVMEGGFEEWKRSNG